MTTCIRCGEELDDFSGACLCQLELDKRDLAPAEKRRGVKTSMREMVRRKMARRGKR